MDALTPTKPFWLADIPSRRDAVALFSSHPVRRNPGLEYIEEEVLQMLKGVDLDGNDSIEWKVGAALSNAGQSGACLIP